jgi:spore maturation protein CgeB
MLGRELRDRFNNVRVLYCGDLRVGRGARARYEAMAQLVDVVGAVDTHAALSKGLLMRIEYRSGIGPGISRLNRQVLETAKALRPNVIWIDSGRFIMRSTVQHLQRGGAKVVYLNPDDPFGRYRYGWRTFLKALPEYDLHFVARAQNVEEYRQLGAREVHPYDRSFDPALHRPVVLNREEKQRFCSPVGFIGFGAERRAEVLAFLLDHDVPLAIWGNGFESTKQWPRLRRAFRGEAIFGEDYAKAICGLDIVLHFLRRENRDEQDSRTFEITACGSFMLAERSATHDRLFQDGKEAVFFDSPEDCLTKIRFFLANPRARAEIASAGYKKCLSSGYDHKSRLQKMLYIVTQRLQMQF